MYEHHHGRHTLLQVAKLEHGVEEGRAALAAAGVALSELEDGLARLAAEPGGAEALLQRCAALRAAGWSHLPACYLSAEGANKGGGLPQRVRSARPALNVRMLHKHWQG